MNKMMKKVFICLMSLVFMLQCFFLTDVKVYAKATDMSNCVAKVVLYIEGAKCCCYNNGWVPIESYGYHFGDANGNGALSSGSGFFVGKPGENPSNFVTNNHVIEDFLSYDDKDQNYYKTSKTLDEAGEYPIYLKFETIELRIYYSEDDYDVAYVKDHGDTNKVDLALLRIKTPTSKRQAAPLMIPDDEKLRGETVYAYGFPGISDNALSSGTDTYENPTMTSGVYNQVVNDDKGVERINSDAKTNFGNSGGPLCTEDGCVIGVNTNGITESSDTRYYAISASHVVEMLDANDVDYADYSTSSNGMWLAILSFFAVFVVIIVLLFVIKNKKSKKQSSMITASSEAGVAYAIQNGQRFCVGCGKPLHPEAMFCPMCGTKNETTV